MDGLSEAGLTDGEIAAQIAHIRSLGKDELRSLWRSTFKTDVPSALTKDLLARMLIWRMQEERCGGLNKTTIKLLQSHADDVPVKADAPRRFKSGTFLIRDYQGHRHSVTVVPEGFVWNETTYKSLSIIARKITGSRWNGPRFFGLRENET